MTAQHTVTPVSDRQERIAALDEEYQAAKAAYDSAYASWEQLVDAPEYRAAQDACTAAYQRWSEIYEPIEAASKVVDQRYAALEFAGARLDQALAA